MNSITNKCTDIEEDQLSLWLKQPQRSMAFYYEPMLEESTMETIKTVCDVLRQTDEVFIMSVDILEKYIQTKPHQSIDSCNGLLIIACGVFLSRKFIGSDPVRIADLQKVILKMSKENIERDAIKKTELDILLTLEKLPLSTAVTDLNIFLQYYINSLKLPVNIEPLCLDMLILVYISKKELFNRLKIVYAQNEGGLCAFKHLNCCKFYYPGGIVLCVIKMTKLKNILNVKQIAEDIGRISAIHSDHFQLLATAIQELLTTSTG